MKVAFYTRKFYEPDGTQHTVEGFANRTRTPGFKSLDGAPYMLFVDGAFYADAETGLAFLEEVESLSKWFGWLSVNPCFS